MSGPCSRCGTRFTAPSRKTGRQRSVCDGYRTNHEKIDGTRWRKLPARVLVEQPVCVVAGCGPLSTSVDHVVPLARGGYPYDRRNLQAMCASHNASKGARMWAWGEPAATSRCSCGDPECPGGWHI